jgi:predicted metal-binding membrane protein
VTAVAWTLLVFAQPLSAPSDGGPAPAHMMAEPMPAGHHHLMGADTAGSATLGNDLALGLGWVLMVTAMMAPLLIPSVRHVYARSLRSRRGRAIGLVTVGAMAVWMLGSVALLAVATLLRSVTGSTGWGLAAGLVLAAAWQVSPWKQYCLNRHCTQPPLPSFGRAADLAALRYGCTHAAWCLGSCWALMLVSLLAPAWHLAAMLVVSVWMWVEPFERPARPSWRVRVPRRVLRIVSAAIRRRPVLPARVVVAQR